MEAEEDGAVPVAASPRPSQASAFPAEPPTQESPKGANASPSPSVTAPPPGPAETTPPTTSEAPGPVPRSAPLRQHTLRDRIVEHLRATQTDSISGIARVLAATGDAPVHRLTVAGYLQAMAETGVLRELDRPPSKLYQLQNPESHWSLHQRVHRALQETPLSETDRSRLALAVLQRLLGRPIFQAELRHAGFHDVADVERTIVGDQARRQFRELFARRASPRIEIPQRDPLLSLREADPLLTSAVVEETMRKVLLRATSAEHLVADRPTGPQQAQLELGGDAS